MIGKHCCCGTDDCPCTGGFNYFQIVMAGWGPGDNPGLYNDINGTHLVPVENSRPHVFPQEGRCWGDIVFDGEILRPTHPDFEDDCTDCTELVTGVSAIYLYAHVAGFGFPTITHLDLETRFSITGSAKTCYGVGFENYVESWVWRKRIAVAGCTSVVDELLTVYFSNTLAGLGGCTTGNLDDSGASCTLSLIL